MKQLPPRRAYSRPRLCRRRCVVFYISLLFRPSDVVRPGQSMAHCALPFALLIVTVFPSFTCHLKQFTVAHSTSSISTATFSRKRRRRRQRRTRPQMTTPTPTSAVVPMGARHPLESRVLRLASPVSSICVNSWGSHASLFCTFFSQQRGYRSVPAQ